MAGSATPLAGCLLGQALGDALGFVVESAPAHTASEYVAAWLLAGNAGSRSHPDFAFGQYTDDTQLARELLCSLRDAGGWDVASFAGRLASLFRDERAVGAGPGTRGAAMRLLGGTRWSESGEPAPYSGNGSAMRAAPLGVFFRGDIPRMVVAAREQALVTHRDPRCVAGAITVAGAAALAASGGQIHREEFIDTVASLAGQEDGSVADAIHDLRAWLDLAPAEAAVALHASGLDTYGDVHRGISSFVTPSVVWSLYAFLRTPDDYWATICTAIAVGGDTDTMAAIAGAISGARLGPSVLPPELVSRLNDRGQWRASELLTLARDCAALPPAFAGDR